MPPRATRWTSDNDIMIGRACLVAVAAMAVMVSLTVVPASPASPALDVERCLELTTAKGLDTSAIVSDLPISRDQKVELRSRLVTYNSVRGFAGLDGIGLTDDQVALVMKRIDAQVASWNAHPLGWPCVPFAHRARTVAWVKAKLVANGFRPASVRVTNAVPRQLRLAGIQDGVDVVVIVARTGGRGVVIRLVTTHSGGGTYRFVVPFVP